MMSHNNTTWHINCTAEPNRSECTHDSEWDRCYHEPGSATFYAIVFVIILIFIMLLLTVLSPRTRLHSPMWYVYHLQVVLILTAVGISLHHFITNIHGRNGSYSSVFSFIEMIGLLTAVTLVLLNLEIFTTIFNRKLFFVRTAKPRFYGFLGITWGIGFIWELTFMIAGVDPCEHHWKEFVMYILRGLITSICLFVFIIVHTSWFICCRNSGAAGVQYDPAGQASDLSAAPINVKEWFIYIIIVNVLYFILSMTAEFVMTGYDPVLSVLVIGFVILVLSTVRTTIRLFVHRVMTCKNTTDDEDEPTVTMTIDPEDSI